MMRLKLEAQIFFGALVAAVLIILWVMVLISDEDRTGLGICTIGILMLTIPVCLIAFEHTSGPR